MSVVIYHGEDAAAAVVPIHREVAAVQAAQVARLHVAPVGLRLGVGVAGELQHGAAEEHAGAQRAPRKQAADLRWRHVVPNEGDVAGAGVLQKVPAVALSSGVVLTAVEAVGGDLRVHFCRGVIGRQGVGDGRGDLGLRPVLGHVQPRHHGVDLGLRDQVSAFE